MPIDDWTRAPSGYFHHFHQQWTCAICDAPNAGLLPREMFALIGAAEPPETHLVSREADEEIVYAAKANRVALHREDETIAVIEIISPGNKASQIALRQVVNKSSELLERGIHLLVIDLFPPTRRDPGGIHPATWSGINDDPFTLPADKTLTLASYAAGSSKSAYVDPVATGGHLPAMPLFLDANTYFRVPLEKTYEATWKACPEEFKERVI